MGDDFIATPEWSVKDVSVSHVRRTKYGGVTTKGFCDYYTWSNGLEARGGYTVVTITTEYGTHAGIAVCSKNDGYNKTLGKSIAYDRAIIALHENKLVVAPKAFFHSPRTEVGLVLSEAFSCMGKSFIRKAFAK